MRPQLNMSISRLMAAFIAIVMTGCGPPKVDQENPGPLLITEREVEASRAASAYDVIQKLHPNYLHDRGETSLNKQRSGAYPTVYVDGQEFGAIASLRSIPVSQVSGAGKPQ